MALIFSPKQMDGLIDNRLEGYTLNRNEITDHEDDGRLFRKVSFSDIQGIEHTFCYLWSPWDGNDYTIFARDADEVKVREPTPVVAEVIPAPAVSTRAPITHTLADVKKDGSVRVACGS